MAPSSSSPSTPPSTSTSSSSNKKTKSQPEDTTEFIPFSATHHTMMIPDLFTSPPQIHDDLTTPTSSIQDETVDICLPFLSGSDSLGLAYNIHGVPALDRAKHIRFLHQALGNLPSRFLAADPSRPWFLYWSLAALMILGEDVSAYREKLVATVKGMQNESGGFGGGGMQTSHLAPSYAVVLALALVGGEEAYEMVDRMGMWKWLCRLKQADGGFQVCVGGEEDIRYVPDVVVDMVMFGFGVADGWLTKQRGAYCASVIIKLLNLPLDLTRESAAWTEDGSADLLTGVADYVRRCQTFEGGISGQPNAEAHGAYAFCALGCLALLDDPRRIIPKYLNVPRLVAWLSSRQYAPEGGFSGRTNKLVDGCYSHWVGGCFPLIEAALSPLPEEGGDRLPPAPESLFSREGLIRYILCCCQDQTKRGGLRDKPGKMSDAYHSCYVLSGLSSAQQLWELASPTSSPEAEATATASASASDPVWTVLPHLGDDVQVFEHKDLVRPIHPVYAIPQRSQETIRDYFLAKEGF